MKRIVIAMTGASGAVFGVRMIKYLCGRSDVETHLICSEWAGVTISQSTGTNIEQLKKAADYVYDPQILSAPVASGSFYHDGMVVIPCSMKSLAAIACGFSNNLIARAADVTIKEKRPLVLVARETPLSPIHLENMLKLANIGVTIMPPVPGLYSGEKSLDDIVDTFVGRVLGHLGIENDLFAPWKGME